MVKKLQPKLRFRGFTDAWEQRKGAEVICVRRDTIANPPKDIVDVELENLIEGGGLQGDLSLRTASTSVFHEHDTLFGRLRPYLRKFWFANTSGVKSGEIWSLYSSTLKPEFLYALTQSAQFLNQALQTAGTKMPRAEWKTIAEAYFAVPQAEEQEKIGILFQKLEQLIDAEKRKLQLIEMKKRLLLQRILSGKMRFVGFCDSWIQLKLDDAICVCSGKDYKHLSKGNIPVYGTGGYMTSVSKALSNRDAIGIGRKGTIDKPYVLHAPFWTVDTLFYALPRNGYDLNFLFAVFQNINWKSKNESTGLPSLSKKNIENTCIITPSIDEQCRIGELFSLFDSILDETNQKIRLLEKKKKALLRDMFV